MHPDPVYWRQDPWLALEKPAGLSVFPPHGDPGGDCLLARLLAAHPSQDRPDWPEGFAGGIAHRLDVSTSGQVLAARSPGDLDTLRGLFAQKKLRKRYQFVTARQVPWTQHTVQHRLAHDRRQKRRMTFERGKDTPHRGQWMEAETRLRYLGPLEGGLGLWSAEMRSGVMHQVRVHAASVGLALLGDGLYGGGSAPGPEGPQFYLHHVGLKGPGLVPPPLDAPRPGPSGRSSHERPLCPATGGDRHRAPAGR